MTEADVDTVAEIRVRGWQAAYAGLMPQAFLDAMSVTEEKARRRDIWQATRGGTASTWSRRTRGAWSAGPATAPSARAPRATASSTPSTYVRV
ncbi:hypothetical protein GCM10020000_15370 [Streptomyces olivoverticillatus]